MDVTGAGCAILSSKGTGPKITHVTTGKVIDKGVTDISNMGAAMAPAAIDTLIAHFNDTHRTPDYYDMILTGDLGVVGSDILVELMLKEGFDIRTKHKDCGKMIFDIEEQDVHAGGSGCGCSATVFNGYLLRGRAGRAAGSACSSPPPGRCSPPPLLARGSPSPPSATPCA